MLVLSDGCTFSNSVPFFQLGPLGWLWGQSPVSSQRQTPSHFLSRVRRRKGWALRPHGVGGCIAPQILRIDFQTKRGITVKL